MEFGTETLSTLQQKIDSIYYPPTHTYDLKSLKPTGYLAKRIKVIKQEFPSFFSGDLLDVGCNKGFFSLYHNGKVVGIDPDEDCVMLCRQVCSNGEFHKTTFGEFKTDRVFDKIFIGNGHHYPFIEAKGWSWVNKLAKLSSGSVLLEGPIGAEGADARRCIPKEIMPLFTEKHMMEAFSKQFKFIKKIKSPLVLRYFFLFEKLDDLWSASPKQYEDYLRIIYNKAANEFSDIGTVIEVCARHDRGVISRTILPHKTFLSIDRDPKRGDLVLDALTDELPVCDYLISTAILHHTQPDKIEELFFNLIKNTKKGMVLTGPLNGVLELFGDHLYHIDVEEIQNIALKVGWTITAHSKIGLSKPFCEVFMAFRKLQ